MPGKHNSAKSSLANHSDVTLTREPLSPQAPPPATRTSTASPASPSLQRQELGQVYDDGTNTFFWQAHTVTALVIIVVGLVYVTFLEQTPSETSYNIKRGSIAVVIVFLMIGVIHMPNGPFVRPHPVLWRLMLCIIILYVLLLIFLLFQTADDARQFLTLYDPDLGKPLPERTYAEDCSLYTPDHPNGSFFNFFDKMDVFVPCHLLGWWLKALIFRDFWLLNVVSIWFELMEYTLEPQLPNFGECWWDHWVLDFIVCNGLAIWLGMKTCEYLEIKTYHWSGLWKIPTLKGKLKRVVSQFTPYSWTSYQWGYTESFKRFLVVVFLSVAWMIQELNTFYMKTVLWIPPNHSLNLHRELIYGLCGACAIKEVYDFLASKDSRIGRFSWMVFAALSCEVLLEIKFGYEIFLIPLHPMAYVFWGCIASLLAIWAFWHFTLPFRDMPVIGYHWRRLEDKVKAQ